MFPTDLSPVIIESPFGGRQVRTPIGSTFLSETKNVEYLRAVMHDCLVNHHEAPYASHALYTQPGVLRDDVEEERKLGIGAGFVWATLAPVRVFYIDRGISEGMVHGLKHAISEEQVVVFRRLGGEWDIGYSVEDPDLLQLIHHAGVTL